MKIRLQITELRTDVAQYKPYSPTFVPAEPLHVEVEIPDEEVSDMDNDMSVTLTQDGFHILLVDLADMLAEVHDTFQHHQMRKMRKG